VPQMTKWRMRMACWIPRATNTRSGCVMLVAFPPQQWLHERASMLRYMYITFLVSSKEDEVMSEFSWNECGIGGGKPTSMRINS